MKESSNLRKILSQNIKKARTELHITQVKLAIYSDISVPHMIEIEQCKTWVSDKALSRIAKALNKEVYELLTPEEGENNGESEQKKPNLRQMAEIIKAKKIQLRKNSDDIMDELIMEVIKLYQN